MPAQIRPKGKAMDIAYGILGVPAPMKETYKKPKRKKEEKYNSYPEMDLNKIHADDTGVGRNYFK